MRYFVPWSEQSLSDAPRLAIGMVHIVQVHHYLDSLWKQALWVTIAAAAIASILYVYVRVLTPLIQLRKPHSVVSVALEADRTWTLTVGPQGPWPVRFRAGQFAFLAIADSPFSLQQHPFSISSSSERPEQFDIGARSAIGVRQTQVRRAVLTLAVVMVIAAAPFAL